jgi:hypothetical protein
MKPAAAAMKAAAEAAAVETAATAVEATATAMEAAAAAHMHASRISGNRAARQRQRRDRRNDCALKVHENLSCMKSVESRFRRFKSSARVLFVGLTSRSDIGSQRARFWRIAVRLYIFATKSKFLNVCSETTQVT